MTRLWGKDDFMKVQAVKKHVFQVTMGEPRGFDPEFAEYPDYAPADIENDDVGTQALYQGIDVFAYESGPMCNGPRCVACGAARCHHCDNGESIYTEDCSR